MSNKTYEIGEKDKCPGCDKLLRGTKEPLAKVDLGKLGRNGWKQTGRWGLMHQSCFMIAIGDPKAIDFIAAAS